MRCLTLPEFENEAEPVLQKYSRLESFDHKSFQDCKRNWKVCVALLHLAFGSSQITLSGDPLLLATADDVEVNLFMISSRVLTRRSLESESMIQKFKKSCK